MRNDFNKTYFLDGYGLSCLENYILYYLNENNMVWDGIFYKSYLNFSEIFNYFVNGGDYAFFSAIPRLQNVLYDLKLCNITEYNEINEVINILDKEKFGILISVNKEFIEDRYRINLWRDDHYILIAKNFNNELIFLNDNPREQFKIDKGLLLDIFSGNAIQYIFSGNSDLLDKNSLYEEYFNSIIYSKQNFITHNDISIQMLRDMIGIYRVILKRSEMICKTYFNTDFIIEYINYMNSLYTKVEYMRIRNKFNTEDILYLLNTIKKYDSKYQEQMIERILKNG